MDIPSVYFTVPLELQPGAPTANPDPQTLIQCLAATDHRVIIYGADIGIAGSDPSTNPMTLSWLVQTTAGTNGTSVTPTLHDRGYNESLESTFTHFNASTATEPTAGDVLITFALHRQGTAPWVPPDPLVVTTTERVGLRLHGVDAVQGNNPYIYLTLYCSE